MVWKAVPSSGSDDRERGSRQTSQKSSGLVRWPSISDVHTEGEGIRLRWSHGALHTGSASEQLAPLEVLYTCLNTMQYNVDGGGIKPRWTSTQKIKIRVH